MRYFATTSGDAVREVMALGLLDQILVPGKSVVPDVPFALDNGRFGKNPLHLDVWWNRSLTYPLHDCAFMVAPDVVGDATATWEASEAWLPRIRAEGVPAALAAQNGLEELGVPWDEFDVLFIGGDDDFKLGPYAADLTAEAKSRGKVVHMGRVNSRKRILYAHSIGCDSVDGTYLAFGPRVNLPKLLRWMVEVT